jgi:hypothetical protein
LQKIFVLAMGIYEDAAMNQPYNPSLLSSLVFRMIPESAGLTPPTPTPTSVGYFWSVVYSLALTIVLIVMYIILKWYTCWFGLLTWVGIIASGELGARMIYTCSLPDWFLTTCFNVLCNDIFDVEDMKLDLIKNVTL